jgi:hypothetical protein
MEPHILENDSDYGDKFIFHHEGAESMVSEGRPRSQEHPAPANRFFAKKIFTDNRI